MTPQDVQDLKTFLELLLAAQGFCAGVLLFGVLRGRVL